MIDYFSSGEGSPWTQTQAAMLQYTHARTRACMCVRVHVRVCVCGGGVKDTVQTLKSLTVRQNIQPENMKNCSESQS